MTEDPYRVVEVAGTTLDKDEWTLLCGSCGRIWKGEIIPVHRPRVRCPQCHVMNEVPYSWPGS